MAETLAAAPIRSCHSRCWLVVMAKEPRLGAVKTRLAREIGAVGATKFYRHTMRTVLARLAGDARWRTVVAVAPDTSLAGPFWPRGLDRIGQGGGDLGARMQRLFDRLPPGRAIIVGTDIPTIRPAHIAGAFRLLGAHEAVFGSAGDGGYWLVGLRRTPRIPHVFADVRWSTEHALADTLRNLAGRRVARAATLGDVDDATDHRRHGGAGGRVVTPPRRRLGI